MSVLIGNVLAAMFTKARAFEVSRCGASWGWEFC